MPDYGTPFGAGIHAEQQRIADARPDNIEMIRRGLWLDIQIQKLGSGPEVEELRGRLLVLTMELEGRSWE